MSGVEDRAKRFAEALKSAPVDVADVEVKPVSGGAIVAAVMPPSYVNQAQAIAGGHGFQLIGKDRVDGATRYTFQTWARMDELGDEGLGLPGGVR